MGDHEAAISPQGAQRCAVTGKELRDRGKLLAVSLCRLPSGVRLNRRRIVQPIAVMHPAEERAVMHDLRHVRQVLADLQSRNRGGDWLKFTADRAGSIGLQVISIQMTGAAIIEDKNAGLDFRGGGSPGGASMQPGLEQSTER